MSATAIRKKRAASFEELTPACQILILHEDFSAYTRAVEVCRRIMEQFASELDFDIKCWNFIELAEPNCARHAAKTASAADIILLSLEAPQLPPAIDQWLEFSFSARSKTVGALALVATGAGRAPLAYKKMQARLEQLAERLGLDFLPLPPDTKEAVTEKLPAEERLASAVA